MPFKCFVQMDSSNSYICAVDLWFHQMVLLFNEMVYYEVHLRANWSAIPRHRKCAFKAKKFLFRRETTMQNRDGRQNLSSSKNKVNKPSEKCIKMKEGEKQWSMNRKQRYPKKVKQNKEKVMREKNREKKIGKNWRE